MSVYPCGDDLTQGIYYPSYSIITGITLGQTTVISFEEAHDFTPGEVVSLRVSKPFGTVELNNQQATISSITEFTITLPIVSTTYTPFINAGLYVPSFAMVVPAGSGVDPDSSFARTNLEDAFDHIPP